MSDAIEKALRHLMSAAGWDENVQRIEVEARASLAALRAENARLREALGDALDELKLVPGIPSNNVGRAMMTIEEALSSPATQKEAQ